MRLKSVLAVLAVCGASVTLSACGTALAIETHIPPARARAAAAIPIYLRGQLTPRVAQNLTYVEGVSCKSELWDPVGEKAATLQAQLRALDMHADALVEVQTTTAGTDLEENCWKTVTVTGLAVIFAK